MSVLPGQPPLLGGFLNLRGASVPVVFARRLFGLPHQEPGLYTPVVIAELSGTLLGLCVDRVLGVEELDRGSLKPLLQDHSLNDCADAEFEAGGERVIVLRLERLLLAEERQRLEELSAISRRRMAEIERSRQA